MLCGEKGKTSHAKTNGLPDANFCRAAREDLAAVERVAGARLPTEFGEFRIVGYRSRAARAAKRIPSLENMRPD